MRSDISEIKHAVRVICANEMRTRRSWNDGQRRTRTDAASVKLNVEDVDAVFDEEIVNFVEKADAERSENAGESTVVVENLAQQLATLESQCANLRRLLQVASANSKS